MVSDRELDALFLERAVELAGRGRGKVNPNPMVGAVLARGAEKIGEGWHEGLGLAHAEVAAIADAGGPGNTRGATIYVSLEPCCHEGRTPPCTDALIEAGVSRVVIASDDPSSKASGRGAGILRDEGIEVEHVQGDIRDRAVALNQPFRKHAKTGRPWVVAKLAQSIDGKVASSGGDSKWISGEESRELVHRWRAEVDSIAVGIGTAMSDDPELTSRGVDAQRQPRRVVFDSGARLPLTSRLVLGCGESPLTVVVGRAAARSSVDALEASGVEVLVATGENEAARVSNALDQLGEQGVTSIMLEGGPRLAGAFLDAGEIDQMRIFLAPVIFGTHSARDPFEGSGSESVAASLRIPTPTVEAIGDDLLLTSTLEEW